MIPMVPYLKMGFIISGIYIDIGPMEAIAGSIYQVLICFTGVGIPMSYNIIREILIQAYLAETLFWQRTGMWLLPITDSAQVEIVWHTAVI